MAVQTYYLHWGLSLFDQQWTLTFRFSTNEFPKLLYSLFLWIQEKYPTETPHRIHAIFQILLRMCLKMRKRDTVLLHFSFGDQFKAAFDRNLLSLALVILTSSSFCLWFALLYNPRLFSSLGTTLAGLVGVSLKANGHTF